MLDATFLSLAHEDPKATPKKCAQRMSELRTIPEIVMLDLANLGRARVSKI